MKGAGLWQNCRGTSAVEFAIVAPVLLLFIFGIIQAALGVWTWQVAQETAYAAARCVAIGDPQCEGDASAKQFAVAHAGKSGITLPSSGVTVEKDITCNGIDHMNRVRLIFPYALVGGLVPSLPASVNVAACMPVTGGA